MEIRSQWKVARDRRQRTSFLSPIFKDLEIRHDGLNSACGDTRTRSTRLSQKRKSLGYVALVTGGQGQIQWRLNESQMQFRGGFRVSEWIRLSASSARFSGRSPPQVRGKCHPCSTSLVDVNPPEHTATGLMSLRRCPCLCTKLAYPSSSKS